MPHVFCISNPWHVEYKWKRFNLERRPHPYPLLGSAILGNWWRIVYIFSVIQFLNVATPTGNCMAEFMGLIYGTYDAKKEGFVPGGASLHSMLTPHGPDAQGFHKGTHEELKPVKKDGALVCFVPESSYTGCQGEHVLVVMGSTTRTVMFCCLLGCFVWLFAQAFMFETSLSMAMTSWGMDTCNALDLTYHTCWQGLKKNFDPSMKPAVYVSSLSPTAVGITALSLCAHYSSCLFWCSSWVMVNYSILVSRCSCHSHLMFNIDILRGVP